MLIIILFIILNFSQKTEARSQRNVHGSFSIDDIQKNLFFDVETERNLYETSQKIPIKFIVKNVGYHTFRFLCRSKLWQYLFSRNYQRSRRRNTK